jgi:hypothetical protein
MRATSDLAPRVIVWPIASRIPVASMGKADPLARADVVNGLSPLRGNPAVAIAALPLRWLAKIA